MGSVEIGLCYIGIVATAYHLLEDDKIVEETHIEGPVGRHTAYVASAIERTNLGAISFIISVESDRRDDGDFHTFHIFFEVPSRGKVHLTEIRRRFFILGENICIYP